MDIRTFQPGDETAQVTVYNGAACLFPGFKPSKVEDVQRRTRARGFDPTARFYAVGKGEVVGYCVLEPGQGRVSFPWCRRGHGAAAGPLFEAAVRSARDRGLDKLFAAYRADWQAVHAFFEGNGFAQAREMVNYHLDVTDLPTAATRPSLPISPLERADLPAVADMGRGVVRLPDDKLEAYFFDNPYFPAEAVSVMRSKADGSPVAVGLGLERPTYADVRQIDVKAPCFRLGAFGTEGLHVKRVNGLFSFLVRSPEVATPNGLSLLTEACEGMTDGSVHALAAQAPSDAPHLVAFYARFFREQGRFPVFERSLTDTAAVAELLSA